MYIHLTCTLQHSFLCPLQPLEPARGSDFLPWGQIFSPCNFDIFGGKKLPPILSTSAAAQRHFLLLL